MLDYLEPKSLNEERPKITDLLENIEAGKQNLNVSLNTTATS